MAIDTSLIQDTDWLACTDTDGITYKVSGAAFKDLLLVPTGLELTINTVLQSAGNKIFTLVTEDNKGTVDWGDGTTDDLLSATQQATNEYSLEHDYAVAGIYTVKVTGPPGLYVKGTSTVALQLDGVGYPITAYGPPDADYVLPTAFFLNRFFQNMSQDNIDTFDYSAIEAFNAAWYECFAITDFPLIDISSGTDFQQAWASCTGINTPFPLLDFSSALSLWNAWSFARNMPSPFPSIDVSLCTNFKQAWQYCYALTSFPLLDYSSGTDFSLAWGDCVALSSFPANAFDVTGTLASSAFSGTFQDCALTAASIENILTSLDTNGQISITLDVDGGTNAAKSTWTAAANTAYGNLIVKGWTIAFNP